MIKIGVYLNNKSISNVDCRKILDGNPGIGGSEYAIILLVYFLSNYYNEKISITLYADEIGLLPSSIHVVKITDVSDAINEAAKQECSIFVLKHVENLEIYNTANTMNLKFIVWCHNFANRKKLNDYVKLPHIKMLVCVGREQLDIYRDHRAYDKSCFIYNGVYLKPYNDYLKKLTPFRERKNEVTYIGNLISAKGFHVLAKAWPKVLKKIPDAHLHVIGSGKLYDRESVLGIFGFAEKKYESIFMKYLVDKEEKKLSSVTFHGILGKEKDEILNNTKVGVPNPSGSTETFGYTAVEMQLMGALTTSKKCSGYVDTFFNKKMLYNNENNLSKNIVRLLKSKDNEYKQMYDFIDSNFSLHIVAEKWVDLFLKIDQNIPIVKSHKLINPWHNKKIFRELNRILKKIIPFGTFLPTIMLFENGVIKIKHIFEKSL